MSSSRKECPRSLFGDLEGSMTGRRWRLAVATTTIAVAVTAIVIWHPWVPKEQIVGSGRSVTVSRDGEYDLEVVGSGHSVTSGIGIKVRLPAGAKPQVIRSGTCCFRRNGKNGPLE